MGALNAMDAQEMSTGDVPRKGRPPRVPNERTRYLRVYFAESELALVRQVAAKNYQSMSEFARLAVSDAAEESGAGPIVLGGDRRLRERRSHRVSAAAVERRVAPRRHPCCETHEQGQE